MAVATSASAAEPPFDGTIFIDPDIITSKDPTTFKSVKPAGHGQRRMFDRRVEDFVDVDAWLFDVRFRDGVRTEVQVNPEFGKRAAAKAARYYAVVVGRLPKGLRTRVRSMWIHKGVELYGGGNDNILIHTGQTKEYLRDGILEEALMHEATHTSIDPDYATAPDWVGAQQADPSFISTYARDNPTREDLAESLVPWFAVRFRPGRIDTDLADTIRAAIPNRIAFFDGLGLRPVKR